jgi:hypothetical protein
MEAFKITGAICFIRSNTYLLFIMTGEWLAATKEGGHI